jgi:hypothetical protein
MSGEQEDGTRPDPQIRVPAKVPKVVGILHQADAEDPDSGSL